MEQATQSGPVIDVRDVCFSYGTQEVLHNVSFQIGRRELVAVVGPNGGGKTTLLKLLLGALAPRFGSIRVLGATPEEARPRVGYVPQAIPSGSELLLLDEPVANIDPEHASRMYELFQELVSDVTVMMVSHNLGVVTGHATHVLCVNRTAGLHAIGEVASATFTEAFGGSLTTIRHDADCQVLDPSAALHTPHHGCACGDK